MLREYGYITESGIDFGNGNIVTDKKVIEIANKAKVIFERDGYEAFDEYIGRYIREESSELIDDQINILVDVVISEHNDFTISDIILYNDSSGESSELDSDDSDDDDLMDMTMKMND